MPIKSKPSRASVRRVVDRTNRIGVNARWWEESSPAGLANSVWGIAEALEQEQSARVDTELRCARAYSGQNLESLYDSGFVKGLIDRVTAILGVGVTLNVIKSIIDTVYNKVGKSKVRIQITSKGALWSVQRKAKLATQFLDGAFDGGPDRDAYAEIRRAFKDALVTGTGCCYVTDEGDRPVVERVLPCEIQVSDADAVYGRPRSMFRKRYVSREVLLETYGDIPEAREALERATAADPTTGKNDATGDRVLLREAWHLPSRQSAQRAGKNKDKAAVEKPGDGLYVACIEGSILYQRPWVRTRFPLAFIRANERLVGFWGEGMAEQLLGVQYEITKTAQVAARGLHLMAVPRVFVKPGQQLSAAQINNQIGAVVRTTETPVFHEGGKISQQLFDWMGFLYDKAYEIAGQSQLGASGTIPRGMEQASGEALRQFNDIESERFVQLGQAIEEFTRDVAMLLLDTAKELSERGVDVVVKAKGSRRQSEVSFKEIGLDLEQATIQPFPTSFLPQTPAARVQRLQELVDAGWISPDRAMSYAQMPDFDDDLSLMSVSVDLTKQQIERMLEDGEDVLPIEYQNPQLALEMVTNAYLRGVLDGAPPTHLEKLSHYLDELDYLQASMAQKAVPGIPAMPPEAVPAAMPAPVDPTLQLPGPTIPQAAIA